MWLNVGAVNDDFFGAFLLVLNIWLVLFFMLANALSTDAADVNVMFELCMGRPPSPGVQWRGAPVATISR